MRRQRRAQPLSRGDPPRRGSRCARRVAAVHVAARRDPRQGDGREARNKRAATERPAIAESRDSLFRLACTLIAPPAADAGRGRRPVRHRQIRARARSSLRTSCPRPAPCCCARMSSARQCSASARPTRCRRKPIAPKQREGLCIARRQGAARHRGRSFGDRRRGFRARRRTRARLPLWRQRSRRAFSRHISHRGPCDPDCTRRRTPKRRIRCRC